MSHHEVALNLLQRVKDNTDKDEERCTTEETCESLLYTEKTGKYRKYRYESQEQ